MKEYYTDILECCTWTYGAYLSDKAFWYVIQLDLDGFEVRVLQCHRNMS